MQSTVYFLHYWIYITDMFSHSGDKMLLQHQYFTDSAWIHQLHIVRSPNDPPEWSDSWFVIQTIKAFTETVRIQNFVCKTNNGRIRNPEHEKARLETATKFSISRKCSPPNRVLHLTLLNPHFHCPEQTHHCLHHSFNLCNSLQTIWCNIYRLIFCLISCVPPWTV